MFVIIKGSMEVVRRREKASLADGGNGGGNGGGSGGGGGMGSLQPPVANIFEDF